MTRDPLPASDDTIEIEPAALRDLIRSEGAGSVALVDCREEDEFAICKLPGARLIPLSKFPDAAAPLLEEPDKPVVVYCHHGMRSAEATGFLRSRGLKRTFSLRGGIDAWSREIDPSVARY